MSTGSHVSAEDGEVLQVEAGEGPRRKYSPPCAVFSHDPLDVC